MCEVDSQSNGLLGVNKRCWEKCLSLIQIGHERAPANRISVGHGVVYNIPVWHSMILLKLFYHTEVEANQCGCLLRVSASDTAWHHRVSTHTLQFCVIDHLMTGLGWSRPLLITDHFMSSYVAKQPFPLTSFAPFLPLTEQMERQSLAARGMSEMYISYVSHSFHLLIKNEGNTEVLLERATKENHNLSQHKA